MTLVVGHAEAGGLVRCRLEPHDGGRFRISLTYVDPTATGKTEPQTDTFQDRFVRAPPSS